MRVNYNPEKDDGIRNTIVTAFNITEMYLLNKIVFNAGLKYIWKDPIVGVKLKINIWQAKDGLNITKYSNWTFPDKFIWDDAFYSQVRLLNSEYLVIGKESF
jgi:hypothetical protein